MIHLIPYIPFTTHEEELKNLYLTSFPADERRDWEGMLQLIQHPCFTIYKVMTDNDFAGMVSVWRWPDFTFIEHFAIAEALRSKGLGQQVMTLIINERQTKIILEVDLPDNDAAIRRIAFYKRVGFSICHEKYYQPPYHPANTPVNMLLMSYPEAITPLEFVNIRNRLYKEVYQWYMTDFP